MGKNEIKFILVFCVLAFLSYAQIDGQFKPASINIDLASGKKNTFFFELKKVEPLRLEIDLEGKVRDKEKDFPASLTLNDHLIKEFKNSARFKLVVSDQFLKSGKNKIVCKTKSENATLNINRIRLNNYLGTSPNFPKGHIVFNKKSGIILPKSPSDPKPSLAIFILILASLALLTFAVVYRLFYDNVSACMLSCARIYFLPTLILGATLILSFISPFKLVFPTESLLAIAFLIPTLTWILIVYSFGAVYPVNSFLLPQNRKGAHFPASFWLNLKVKFKKILDKTSPIVFIISCILPIVIYLFFLNKYSINVLYMDQWGQIESVIKAKMGILSFHDLYAPHNEGRMLTANIIFLINGLLTNYNLTVPMFLSGFFLAAAAGLFFSALSNFLKDYSPKLRLALFFPISLLLFSLCQWEVLFRADEMVRIMGNFFVVLILYLLSHTVVPFYVIVLLAIPSTYCIVSGLFIWPVVFILLFLIKDWKKLFVWCFSGLVIFFLYFYNWKNNPGHPSFLYILDHPLEALKFFFILVGNPFFINNFLSVPFGILGISLLFLFFYLIPIGTWKSPFGLFTLGILLISTVESMVISLGRSGFGNLPMALSSRYMHEMTFFWIAILNMFYITQLQKSASDSKSSHFIAGSKFSTTIVFSFLFTGYLCNYKNGIVITREHYNMLSEASKHIDFFEYTPEHLLVKLHPQTDFIRKQAELVKKYNLSNFEKKNMWFDFRNSPATKEGLSDKSIGLLEHVEILDSRVPHRRDEPSLYLSGWVQGNLNNEKIDSIVFLTDNLRFARVDIGTEKRIAENPLSPDNKFYNWFTYIPFSKIPENVKAIEVYGFIKKSQKLAGKIAFPEKNAPFQFLLRGEKIILQ